MARSVDWPALLNRYHVEYVDRGKNVARGHINVKCPWCGGADPSHHMGIQVDPPTGWWGCWRDSNHRGKSPMRLVSRLLRISYHDAIALLGLEEGADLDEFAALRQNVELRGTPWSQEEPVLEEPRDLAFPREFRSIINLWPTLRFHEYLRDTRGFGTSAETNQLVRDYGLLCSLSGDYQDRIILPLTFEDELVSWTARALGNAELRYKDLGLEASLMDPKRTLYNYDGAATGGDILFLVEGPFDVLKLDFFGKPKCRAVALMTASMSQEQEYLLHELSDRFRAIVSLMDTEQEIDLVNSMRMKDRLDQAVSCPVYFMPVPYGAKDAGDLLPGRARAFCEGLVEQMKNGASLIRPTNEREWGHDDWKKTGGPRGPTV